LQYTLETWGRAQRDRYRSELLGVLQQLTELPFRGPARDDLRPGYRSLVIDQYVAFYRVETTAIRVVPIVHERRDVPRDLSK
jgi:toxin ParE1/3/4